ncbi:MAG: GNAT family N-acetyltransferase [Promethearchaeota archaeon]
MSDIITRTFRKEDESEVNQVIKKSFKNPGSNAYPFPPNDFVIVAEYAGRIVGHVSIRPFLVYLHGEKIKCGVLHMVATDPDYQHRGIGHAMLDKAIEIMRKKSILISLLWTPIAPFYEAKGWIKFARLGVITVSRENVKEKILSKKDEIIIEDLDSRFLNSIISLNHQFAKNHQIIAHMTPAYLDEIAKLYQDGSIIRFFHVILKNNKFIGYIYGERSSEMKIDEPLSINVQEWVMNFNDNSTVHGVLDYLLDFDDDFEQVKVSCPVDEELSSILNAMNSKVSLTESKDMIRINSLKNLVIQLKTFLSHNWQKQLKSLNANPCTCMQLMLDEDDKNPVNIKNYNNDNEIIIHFSTKPPFLEIQDETRNSGEKCPVFSTTRKGWALIITGTKSASELIEQQVAKCESNDVIAMLDMIFPKTQSFIRYNTNLFQSHLPLMNIEYST